MHIDPPSQVFLKVFGNLTDSAQGSKIGGGGEPHKTRIEMRRKDGCHSLTIEIFEFEKSTKRAILWLVLWVSILQ